MKFVESPNLPENAKIILIGEKYSNILGDKLVNIGLSPIFVPDNPCVDYRVSGHADLSVLHLGKNELVLAAYLKGSGFAEKMQDLGMEIFFSDKILGKCYPNDAALNLCICGNKIIFNPNSADSLIVDKLTNIRGYEKITIKQGYSKCSVCVLNENTIITSDEGIHRKAVEHGMCSLKIKPGYIDLPGFDYGFIGGAAFKINKKTLAFTGKLDKHPDRQNILDFTSLHNIDVVYITENQLFDVGSVIQIVEKQQLP